LCPLRTFNLNKKTFTKQSTNFTHHGQWWHLLGKSLAGAKTLETFWKGKLVTIENAKILVRHSFLNKESINLCSSGLTSSLALAIALLSMLSLPFCLGHFQVAFFLLLQRATAMQVMLWHLAVSLVVLQHFSLCCRVDNTTAWKSIFPLCCGILLWFSSCHSIQQHFFMPHCLEGAVHNATAFGGIVHCATAIGATNQLQSLWTVVASASRKSLSVPRLWRLSGKGKMANNRK